MIDGGVVSRYQTGVIEQIGIYIILTVESVASCAGHTFGYEPVACSESIAHGRLRAHCI